MTTKPYHFHNAVLTISKEWMSTVKYTNDCATIPSAVLSEVLRYASAETNPPAAHPHHPYRILSTAGFISPPDGAVEAVQAIFVDTEVARIT